MSIPVDYESEIPDDQPTEQESGSDNHDKIGDEPKQLRTGIQEARTEIQALKATVTSLEAQIGEGKDRIRRVCRTNCQYLTELDNQLLN